MKLRRLLNWLILGFLPAFPMKERSKSSVELLRTWRQRLLVKSSTQVHQLTFGHLVSCSTLSSAESSLSEGKMIKNSTQTFANRIWNSPITFHPRPSISWANSLGRTLIDVQALRIFYETRGFKFPSKSMKCSVLDTYQHQTKKTAHRWVTLKNSEERPNQWWSTQLKSTFQLSRQFQKTKEWRCPQNKSKSTLLILTRTSLNLIKKMVKVGSETPHFRQERVQD